MIPRGRPAGAARLAGVTRRSARARARDRAAAGGPRRSSSCSPAGATRSACSTSRCASPAPDAVGALHVNYGLRAEAAADEAHCRALCARLDVRARGRARRAAPRTPATSRPGRATCASAPARALAAERGARLADRPHRDRPGRDGALPPRRVARPPRAARHGRRATGCSCARCSARPARRPPRTARRAGWRGARTPPTTIPRYARNRARAGLVPALRELHPAAERNVVRTAELLREEAAVLDEVVATALAGRDRIEVGHLARAAAGARRGSSCAGSPRTPPAGCAPAPPRALRRRPRARRRRARPRRRRARDRRAAACCASSRRRRAARRRSAGAAARSRHELHLHSRAHARRRRRRDPRPAR